MTSRPAKTEPAYKTTHWHTHTRHAPCGVPDRRPNKTAAPRVNAADSAAKGGPGSDEPASVAGATPAGFEFNGRGLETPKRPKRSQGRAREKSSIDHHCNTPELGAQLSQAFY